MSTRSRAVTKEAPSVDPMKRQLDFLDELSNELDTNFREPIWKTSRSHRVDFGETNPSMQFRCLDLLSASRIEFDAAPASGEEGKTIFSDDQKAALEAKFRRKKYPTRNEKVKLASKLGLAIQKVQNWFVNRRRKWKKEQRKGAVGPSGVRPDIPRISLTQTSCKRSFKSTMDFRCFPEFPAQRHDVPKQPLPPTSFLGAVPLASASHHVAQSFQLYTARSSGTQLRLQQPPAIPSPPSTTGSEHLPHQQVYSPFPGPVQRLPQQQLESDPLTRQTEASSRLTHYPPSQVKPAEPDFHQFPAADSRRLDGEFPFSYSIAKELPNIFGIVEDHEFLSPEHEPWWGTIMATQSDLYHNGPGSLSKEDFTDDASPSYTHVQSNNFNSCRFSSSQMSSPPPSTELSCGLISKGRSLSFYRQN